MAYDNKYLLHSEIWEDQLICSWVYSCLWGQLRGSADLGWLLSCMRVGWLSSMASSGPTGAGCFFLLSSSSKKAQVYSQWQWQEAKVSKPKPVSTPQASACIMFAPIPLGKVSHMSELQVREGEYQKCGCREGWSWAITVLHLLQLG